MVLGKYHNWFRISMFKIVELMMLINCCINELLDFFNDTTHVFIKFTLYMGGACINERKREIQGVDHSH